MDANEHALILSSDRLVLFGGDAEGLQTLFL